MEDEKKKKRNKKKKNKQNKTTEEDIVRNGQNEEEKHVSIPEIPRDSNFLHTDHRSNGVAEHSAELEKAVRKLEDESKWRIQKEFVLQETIKQLQEQNDSHAQKEASLEETIQTLRNLNDSFQLKQASSEEAVKTLRDANDSCTKKQASLEETIEALKSTNDSYLQKQASLEETIKRLRDANNLYIQKQAIFEETISQFRDENSICKHKQADLESKIMQLQSEKDSWLQKEETLVEKLKQLENERSSRILSENTTKETIGKMNVDITRLQMQVVELEESRNIVVKENQQLLETISSLQSQLQNLQTNTSSANKAEQLEKHATVDEDLNAQIEAAGVLIGNLVTENAELVEKVNELYVKLERQSVAAGLHSSTEVDLLVKNSETAILSEPTSDGDKTSASELNQVSPEGEALALTQYSSHIDPDEIVQIPVNDGQIQDLEHQSVKVDEKEAVPFSDAPMIGAPFRLISFVAKYVSGADLVSSEG